MVDRRTIRVFLSVPWSTSVSSFFFFFLNTVVFLPRLPLCIFIYSFLFYSYEVLRKTLCLEFPHIKREIHNLLNLLLSPIFESRYIRQNPRFIHIQTHIFSSVTERPFSKKRKKNMRSSIFLVVPFAAVALGQVVRFSTLLPFSPLLQALSHKYILQTQKYHALYTPLRQKPDFVDGSKLTFVFSLDQLARRRHQPAVTIHHPAFATSGGYFSTRSRHCHSLCQYECASSAIVVDASVGFVSGCEHDCYYW